jgi:hypothetical protein
MTIPQEQEWANEALADELHNIIAATIPTIVATRNRVGIQKLNPHLDRWRY